MVDCPPKKSTAILLLSAVTLFGISYFLSTDSLQAPKANPPSTTTSNLASPNSKSHQKPNPTNPPPQAKTTEIKTKQFELLNKAEKEQLSQAPMQLDKVNLKLRFSDPEGIIFNKLADSAESGHPGDTAALIELYFNCVIQNFSTQECARVSRFEEGYEDQYGQSYFDKLIQTFEKKAHKGDISARFLYWRVLKHAVAGGLINTTADPYIWLEKRNTALFWMKHYALNDFQGAALTLAIDYWDGQYIPQDRLTAAAYAKKEQDLMTSSPSGQEFYNVIMRSGLVDGSKAEKRYIQIFGK